MHICSLFKGGDMMKQIANFFITGMILWIAARFFPEYVRIDGIGTLILAAILLFVAETVVALALFLFFITAALSQNWAAIVVIFAMVFFAEILAITLLSAWLPGLTIIGFWPKFLLAFAFSAFRISSSRNDN